MIQNKKFKKKNDKKNNIEKFRKKKSRIPKKS